MGRLSLLTLRIGLTCMRASSPTGFRHGSAVLNVCAMVLITLPGLQALQQDPGPKTSSCLLAAWSSR